MTNSEYISTILQTKKEGRVILPKPPRIGFDFSLVFLTEVNAGLFRGTGVSPPRVW